MIDYAKGRYLFLKERYDSGVCTRKHLQEYLALSDIYYSDELNEEEAK